MEDNYPKRPRKRILRRKTVAGRCDVCGQEMPLCYKCQKCGYLICQQCMAHGPRRFSCNTVTWVCPNCLNWETL